jgi:hypothetical protein
MGRETSRLAIILAVAISLSAASACGLSAKRATTPVDGGANPPEPEREVLNSAARTISDRSMDRTLGERDADAARLRGKVREVCALSPLTLDGALAILGLRRGRALKSGPVNWEWEVAGNDLIARARAGDSGGPYVEITPAPRLALSFEDLVPAFIDAPYFMESTTGHLDADTLHSLVTSNYHIFRVAAGELRIRIPKSDPGWNANADEDGAAGGLCHRDGREPAARASGSRAHDRHRP